MSEKFAAVKIIKKNLVDLYDSTGFLSNGEIKSAITEASASLLKKIKENSEFEIEKIAKPFILGLSSNGDLKIISLNFFISFFSQQIFHQKIGKAVLMKTMETLLSNFDTQNDEISVLEAKLIRASLKNEEGIVFLHSVVLYKIIYQLCNLLISVTGEKESKMIQKIIQDVFSFFSTKTTKDKCEEDSTNKNVMLEISKEIPVTEMDLFIPPFPPKTNSSDIDFAIVLLSLSKATECDKSGSFSSLCLSLFNNLLHSEIPLLKKAFFVSIVKNIFWDLIKNSLKSPKIVEANLISDLILSVYSVVGESSLKMICSCIKNTILPEFQNSTSQASKIIILLSENPELFIKMHLQCPEEDVLFSICKYFLTPAKEKEFPSRNGITAFSSLLQKMLIPVPNRVIFSEIDNNAESSYKLFREKPTEAIKKFIKDKKITNSQTESITKFLYEDKKLDRYAKGYFLTIMNHKYIDSYMNNIDFANLSFFESFKDFFSSVFIPPKQKIVEQIISSFATAFHNKSSSAKSFNACYHLVFSTYILHNRIFFANAKHEVNVDEYLKENAEYEFGEEFLKEVFNEVCKEQIYPVINIKQLMTHEELKFVYQMEEKNALSKDYETKNTFYFANKMFCNCKKMIINSLFTFSCSPRYSKIFNSFSLLTQVLFTYAARSYDYETVEELEKYFEKTTNLRKNEAVKTQLKINQSVLFLNTVASNSQYISGYWQLILQESSALLKLTNDATFMKQIISSTSTFNIGQITEFFISLINVVQEELYKDEPSFTMMDYLVELVRVNKERPIIVWEKIWPLINNFILKNGISDKENIAESIVAFYEHISIDILTIVQKRHFHAQYALIIPFVKIFDQQRNFSIKKAIVESIFSIVKGGAGKLKTGWDIIFQCLTSAVIDKIDHSTCVSITKYAAQKCIDYVTPYIVHMMALVSLLISSASDETEALNGVELFKIIGENMHPLHTDPWMCLIDNLVQCKSSVYENVAKRSEEIFVALIDERKDIPDPVFLIFLEKVENLFFKSTNYNSIVSILSDHEEYRTHWAECIPIINKLAFKHKLVSKESFSNYIIKCKEEISKDAPTFFTTLIGALSELFVDVQIREFILTIYNEFEGIDNVTELFKSLVNDEGSTLYFKFKMIVDNKDFASADKLLDATIDKYFNDNENNLQEMICALQFISSLELEAIRQFSKETLLKVVKLIKDNNVLVRNQLEKIFEKLI